LQFGSCPVALVVCAEFLILKGYQYSTQTKILRTRIKAHKREEVNIRWVAQICNVKEKNHLALGKVGKKWKLKRIRTMNLGNERTKTLGKVQGTDVLRRGTILNCYEYKEMELQVVEQQKVWQGSYSKTSKIYR
jgi:hypothetical protein